MTSSADPDAPLTPSAVRDGDAPITIGVLGSCMTRDAFNSRFNPGYRAWYRVTVQQNQPSLISLLSEPIPIEDEDLGTLGSWNARRVRDDFAKRLLCDIAANPPDYLLVDFAGDVRFGVLQVGADQWVTHTRVALGRTPWYAARAAAGPLFGLDLLRDTDAYLERWTAALARLADRLCRDAPATTVVLVRALHQRRLVVDRSGRTVPLADHRAVRPLDLDRLDRAWAGLDEHALATCGWRSIDLRGRDYPTSDAHPWGVGYLHFSPDYYPDLLAGLHAIHRERAAAAGEREPAGMDAFVAARDGDPGRGRPWDDEPGRGHLQPAIRRRRRLARLRHPVRRLRRHIRSALARVGVRALHGK